jgi:hypothetical protein
MRDLYTSVRTLLACIFLTAAPCAKGDPATITFEHAGNASIDIFSLSETGALDVNPNVEAVTPSCTPAGNIPFPYSSAVTYRIGCEAGDTLNQSPFVSAGGVLTGELFFSPEVQAQIILMNPAASTAEPVESSTLWLPLGASSLIVLIAGRRVLRIRRRTPAPNLKQTSR